MSDYFLVGHSIGRSQLENKICYKLKTLNRNKVCLNNINSIEYNNI